MENNNVSNDWREIIELLTKDIPVWKLVLIDKLTDFKVWFWLKTHKGVDNGNDD